ncbi:MAG TPA: hypothetical protein VFH29_06675, partial [Anaerolineales bacterium]|nr:hypothetical protein [Anaerolineales bacterium]
TPYPASYIPTVVYLTARAIDSSTRTASSPTATVTLTPTFLPPTSAPTLSPTPGPRVPYSAIQVTSPGAMSRIVSPLRVQALAISADSRRIEIGLFGEDGRLLGRSLVAVPGSELGDAISVKIPFEIRAAGETGFVQVSTRDLHGRIQSLITVPLLLLSSGESQVNPAGNMVYERVALSDLPPKSDISGGVMRVSGAILPYNRSPVIMELVSNGGISLSLRLLNVAGADWQSVETTLPYAVENATPARLYIHQADELLGGEGYVFSLPLNLLP